MPNNPPQFKSFQSISLPKSNTGPSFKSPLPERGFGAGEPLKVAPEREVVKSIQDISAQKTTKASTAFTKPAPQTHKFHYDPHAFKNWKDDSFWASLLTILAIPVLLLLALFDIIVKAAPWATGPS